MKLISDLGDLMFAAVVIGNGTLAANANDEQLLFCYDYLENYMAFDIDKTVYGGAQFRIIVEPPKQWGVSLRGGLGISADLCPFEEEVNIYVLKRRRAVYDSTFYKPVLTARTSATGYNSLDYSELQYLNYFDECIALLQQLFSWIYAASGARDGSIEIIDPDGKVDIVPMGVTSKDECGIMKAVKIKFYA